MLARAATLVLALCAAVPAAGDTKHVPEVRTLSSAQPFTGEILSVSDKEVRLRTAEGREVTIPGDDVLQVDLQPPAKSPSNLPYLEVRLTDGSLLRCNALAMRGKNAEVRLFNGLALKFPIAAIHWVLCDAQNEQNRKEFEEQLAGKPKQDALRLLSRDSTGINPFEGFIGDADAEGKTLAFTVDGEKNDVDVARVRSMIFSRQPSDKSPQPVCKVEDTSQNVLYVYRVVPNGDGYQVATPAGVTADLPRLLVQRFDFSLGKVAWLSDLEPVRVEETPLLADIWRYRRDKNLEGGPLSLAKKTYRKGLAVHSRTLLEYDVKGYNVFHCVVGIDDLVTGPAHAVVRIDGDGKELFAAAVTGRDKPRQLELKISGIGRLRLVVDYGEDLDLGDHVDFADARVTK